MPRYTVTVVISKPRQKEETALARVGVLRRWGYLGAAKGRWNLGNAKSHDLIMSVVVCGNLVEERIRLKLLTYKQSLKGVWAELPKKL